MSKYCFNVVSKYKHFNMFFFVVMSFCLLCVSFARLVFFFFTYLNFIGWVHIENSLNIRESVKKFPTGYPLTLLPTSWRLLKWSVFIILKYFVKNWYYKTFHLFWICFWYRSQTNESFILPYFWNEPLKSLNKHTLYKLSFLICLIPLTLKV